MTKRILIFSLDYYPGEVGGAEIAIEEITKRIDQGDVEFHMVSMHYDSEVPKKQQIGNVLVHQVGIFSRPHPTIEERGRWPLKFNKMYFQFAAAFKATALHHRYKYDGIWVMMAHGAGVPAVLFKFFHPAVPYALTLQEGDPPEHIEKIMRPLWPLFKRVFTKADVIQVISHFLEKWARHMGYQGEVVFIPNGASTQSVTAKEDKEVLAELKRQVGKREGEVLLISVSRLAHKNAVDDVIRSLVFLPEHIKLLVVGGGEEEEKLRSLVKELGLQDRVHFTGNVDRTLTARYRQISDIFVRPSRSEGFGNSFASSMVMRLPVIATQEGGIADFLFDRQRDPDRLPTGWAVNKDAPEQIAKQVEYILAHPAEVKETTENAYQMVMTTYNWEYIAKAMRERVFGRLLKN